MTYAKLANPKRRGRKPGHKNKPIKGLILNEKKAAKAVMVVNDKRRLLALRLATVRMWGETANKRRSADHPLIQALYEMRDEFNYLKSRRSLPDARALDNDQEATLNTTMATLLAKIFDSSLKLYQESNKSSVELYHILQSTTEGRQREREHSDRMAVLRAKLGTEGFTPAELEEMAQTGGGVLLPQAQVIETDVERVTVVMDQPQRVAETVVPYTAKTTGMGPMRLTDDASDQ